MLSSSRPNSNHDSKHCPIDGIQSDAGHHSIESSNCMCVKFTFQVMQKKEEISQNNIQIQMILHINMNYITDT